MDKVLIKGAFGHYARYQLYECSFVAGCEDGAYFFQLPPLWDFSAMKNVPRFNPYSKGTERQRLLVATSAFGPYPTHRACQRAMILARDTEVAKFKGIIAKNLRTGTDFSIGPLDIKWQPENGHVIGVSVFRDGKHIEDLKGVFGLDWEPGEAVEYVADVIMRAAVIDPDPPGDCLRPTLAELVQAAWNAPRKYISLTVAEEWVEEFEPAEVAQLLARLETCSTLEPNAALLAIDRNSVCPEVSELAYAIQKTSLPPRLDLAEVVKPHSMLVAAFAVPDAQPADLLEPTEETPTFPNPT